MFVPYYNKEVDMIVKVKDLLASLALFIGMICSLLNDTKNYDIVYYLVFIPIIIYGCLHFDSTRRATLIKKIKEKSLKLDEENEYAMHLLMSIISGSMNQDLNSEEVFGDMMSLVLAHIEDCAEPYCLCAEIENFCDLLRLGHLNNNMEVLPLVKHEYLQYKKIIDDQSMVGTVSSITDLALKKSAGSSGTSSETVQQNQQDRKALPEKEDEDNESIQKTSKKAKKNKKSVLSSTYRVDVDQTKHRYISEVLYFFIYEIQQKYPESYKIQLLANYFSLHYKKKEMLCIFQMRSFNKKKLSWTDRCSYIISEKYFLDLISKNQEQSEQTTNDQNFNGEYFIKLNQLQLQFNQCIESLSKMIVDFWRTFEKSVFPVQQTQKDGNDIATDIKRVFEIFNELDSLKLQKDYQMYFQFAIVQLHILNDPASYDLYIGKMKSILEINKIYQKNFSQSQAQHHETQNFVVVNANGENFGEIIQCNHGLRALLGYTDASIKRQKIDSFMPSLIRQKHNLFIKRFNQTGQSFIINRNMTVFMKKANGYIFPVELYIRFHYSIDYQYTFLAVCKPYYEMSPFGNEVKYNVDQLLFMIVENDEEGRITEISESSIELFHNLGINQAQLEFQDNAGLRLFISELATDLNYQEFCKGRKERYLKNEIYENIHMLDMSVFQDSSTLIGHYDLSKLDQNSTLANFFLNNGGHLPAKTRIFEERYSGGVLDMNIFCFAFLSQQEMSASSSHQSNQQQITIDQKQALMVLHKSQRIMKATTVRGSVAEIDDEDLKNRDEGSHTASGSSSSQGDSSGSSTSSMEFRNFHSFNEQQTPQTLVLIIRLMIILYIIMIAVASLNIGITIQKQMQSDIDIQTVKNAYDRLNWVSRNQLLLRVQLNIANNYEPKTSKLLDDRIEFYRKIQGLRIQALKETQSLLEKSEFVKSSQFIQYEEGRNIGMISLSPLNQQITQYESLNVAFNLYIAKMTEINSYNISDFIGNTYAQTLMPNNSNNYRPTVHEQALYYASHNGLRPLMHASIDSCDFYAREAEDHANENKTTTLVTAIGSVTIIFVIGLIIAPILTKAEARKYNALLFFLKIPKAQISILIHNCEYCLHMNDENRYAEIMRDYESFLGIKLFDQSIEKLRQAREKQLNLENQASRDFNTDGPRSTEGGGTIGSNVLVQHQRTAGSALDSEEEHYHNNSFKQTMSAATSLKSQKSIHEKYNKMRKDITMSLKMSIKDQIKSIIQEEEEGEDEPQEVVHKKIIKLSQTAKQLPEITEAMKRDLEEAKTKETQILVTAKKRRFRMVVGQLLIIAALSTYFLLAYFLSIRTFQTASDIIQDLEIILYKGACIEQTINFLREKEIRNQSILIRRDWGSTFDKSNGEQIPATEYYLDFCEEQEKTFSNLRKEPPAYFEDIQGFISNLESDQVCSKIYEADPEHMKLCEKALNGVLLNGLSNAFAYMYQQIMKQHLDFADLGATFQRNEANLKKEIADETIVEMIDLKAEILNPALSLLKDKAVAAVGAYGKKLINDYVIAFVVFAVLLSLGTLILIFGSIDVLKRSMWNTNIILKILPFETLAKQEREDIKNFFKQ